MNEDETKELKMGTSLDETLMQIIGDMNERIKEEKGFEGAKEFANYFTKKKREYPEDFFSVFCSMVKKYHEYAPRALRD